MRHQGWKNVNIHGFVYVQQNNKWWFAHWVLLELGASYTFTDPPRIYAMVPYMEPDTDEGGSCRRFTDLLWSATLTQGPVCGCPFDWFFNPQTLSVSICSRSVADPVRSGYVLGDICWHGRITDERDATRTSRMGIRTIRTLADELRMRLEELRIPHPYGLPGKIKHVWFFCNGLGILSDLKHAATDRYRLQHAVTGLTRMLQMPLWMKIWSVNHSTFFNIFQIR